MLTHTKQRRRKRGRQAILLSILILLAIAILTVVAMTLAKANQLMREPAKQLEPFAINILPRFEPVSFYSLGDQIRLSGWLMKPNGNVRGTIVLVHDQGSNRLPYELDSADLFTFFTGEGFQVLSFDLRASGESGGELSTFGYMESDDVLAAISVAKRNTPDGRVLLYGLGAGTAAVLSAYDRLPQLGQDMSATEKSIRTLEIYRQDIVGILLDTPAATASDYIRARIKGTPGLFGKYVYPWALPLGVRLSGGNRAEIDENLILSRVLAPVWITRNVPDYYIDNELSDPLIAERLRQFPTTTRIYETRIEGHLSGYILNRDAYFADLRTFFNEWFAPQ